MDGQTDKLVVLARGLGTRMRRADRAAALDERQAAVADTGVKALMPMGRPFLDYVLSAAADAGFRCACLVVGPEHEAVRDYYTREARPRRLGIEFAVQPEPKGTADAVLAAEACAGAEEFAVINSDNYYPPDALRELRAETGSAVALFEHDCMVREGNVPPERLRQFAVGKIDAEGFLADIIEKPDAATLAGLPRPLRLSMNCWRFTPAIFKAARAIGPSTRGEYEIPDAVRYAIRELGERFRVLRVRAAVLDLSTRQDVAAVAARLAGTEVEL